MGTRAQFFIGNPEDLGSRKWLGCVAFDGYVGGDCGQMLAGVTTETEFVDAISMLAAVRDDFTNPATHSFPFPWRDDLFLTDYTYAFFDGRVQVTCFHHGWRDLPRNIGEGSDDLWPSEDDELPNNVMAPDGSGPKGPDSIMIFSA